MNQFNMQSQIEALQSQISVKKTEYKAAIDNGKEFEEVKKIFLQIKDLEKNLNECHEKVSNNGLG